MTLYVPNIHHLNDEFFRLSFNLDLVLLSYQPFNKLNGWYATSTSFIIY